MYSGPLKDLHIASSTNFGLWDFSFTIPPLAEVGHGDTCVSDIIFNAWLDGMSYEESGWHDTETLSISLSASMIVLNEIFARPLSGATAPKDKEYIELYNNGNTPVDLGGWKISDISGSSENFYTISTAGGSFKATPQNGSTVIPPHGYMVLNLSNGSALNNTGDTVRLYMPDNTLVDTHTYPGVPTGKSVVRFPDGLGYWVDPEPTPGEANIVTEAELSGAGFDEQTLRNIETLLTLLDKSHINQTNTIETTLLPEEVVTPITHEDIVVEVETPTNKTPLEAEKSGVYPAPDIKTEHSLTEKQNVTLEPVMEGDVLPTPETSLPSVPLEENISLTDSPGFVINTPQEPFLEEIHTEVTTEEQNLPTSPDVILSNQKEDLPVIEIIETDEE